MKRALFFFGLLIALGCGGPYRRSAPGERVEMGVYTVEPQIAWSITTNKIWQGWTVDGYALHELSFVNGLKDGQPLYPRLQQRENAPQFRSGMFPEDMALFIRSTLEFTGAKRIKSSEPKPQPFGSRPGHRLEVEYANAEDLDVQNLFVWTIQDQRLYLIHYRAAKEHYFAKYLEAVEKIIASIR